MHNMARMLKLFTAGVGLALSFVLMAIWLFLSQQWWTWELHPIMHCVSWGVVVFFWFVMAAIVKRSLDATRWGGK